MSLKITVKYGNIHVEDLRVIILEHTDDKLVVTYLNDPDLLKEIVDRAVRKGQFDATKLSADLLKVLFELVTNHADTLTDELKEATQRNMRELLSIVRVTSRKIERNQPLELATISLSGEQVPLTTLSSVTEHTIHLDEPAPQ